MSKKETDTSDVPEIENETMSVSDYVDAWTEAELLYFPYSPRVLPGAVANNALEASIAEYFNNCKSYGIKKIDLATHARVAGLRLEAELGGVELSDSDVKDLIKAQDQEAKGARVKQAYTEIRRPDQITGPLLSVEDLIYSDPEPPRSPVQPGLHIIFGGANSSKSYRLSSIYHYLTSMKEQKKADFSLAYLIIGEPDHRSKGSWPEIIATIRYGLIDNGDVLVPDVLLMDSFKDLLYMPGGNTMSGGVTTDFILNLSNLSAQLMREGRAVVAVVNPSQEKLMADLFETIRSNATSIFAYNLESRKSEDRTLFTKFKSAMRKWTGTYYDRPEGNGIMALFGAEGDVLELSKAQEKAKETHATQTSVVIRKGTYKPSNLAKKLRQHATTYAMVDSDSN